MRVIFFGTHCAFSTIPLRILLEEGIDVSAVILPAQRSAGGHPLDPLGPPALPAIPVVAAAGEPSIVSLAWEQRIPTYQVRRLAAPEVSDLLAHCQARVACVACFPWRIPAALLTAPRLGFLNIHPSLLPANRGPHPLFWMLRHDDRAFGVTVHFMDERWDTGDIAAQAHVTLPDGVSGEDADRVLAQHGGELLVEVLRALEQGTATRQAQAGGSYYPAPQDEDFVIEPTWSAQRAFNFMRGTSEWEHLYPIEIGGQTFFLRHAHFYAAAEVLGAPFRLFDDQIDSQFAPGVLRAQRGGQVL